MFSIDGPTCYQSDEKTVKNSPTKTAEYFRRGAEIFEHGECQYALGYLYLLKKIHTPQPNVGLVAYWYEKAISNEIPDTGFPLH